MEKCIGRGISERFIMNLKKGALHPILEAVICDDTLCLEIRDNYVNIYYRGGNLLRIEENGADYPATFDKRYCEHKTVPSKYRQQIMSALACKDYTNAIPFIKAEMDLYFFEHPKLEREIQQHILRENNCTSHAKDTDYYIADIEYANSRNRSRFDMLAVKWPSTSISRKSCNNLGLSFIEVKYGDNALTKAAGLKKHFEDIVSFLSNHDASSICAEVQQVFNQKIELGLINGIREQARISLGVNERAEFILLLANHKPASSIMKSELENILQTSVYKDLCKMAEIRIAHASHMGYGLFDKTMLTLEKYVNEG
jgi:hypothetical protein